MSNLNDLRILINIAIGSRLNEISDKNSMIIKGHIFIDGIFIKNNKNDSFYKSTLLLINYGASEELINCLKELNSIRNHIAHEFEEVNDDVIDKWAEKVLSLYPAEYYTRKTKRTKIVFALTALANQVFLLLHMKENANG